MLCLSNTDILTEQVIFQFTEM